MKIAVISDIHGNMEAFGRVLDDISQLKVKKIVCLGDMIGYGPEPEAVVQRIQASKIPTVMGNHELAVANPKILKYFNPLARRSLQLTARMLSTDSMQYIRDLKPVVILNGSRLVHGVPPDSITSYLFQLSDAELAKTFDKYPEPVCFVGHTHMGEKITYGGHKITHQALPEGVTPLESGQRHIINVGSIGNHGMTTTTPNTLSGITAEMK